MPCGHGQGVGDCEVNDDWGVDVGAEDCEVRTTVGEVYGVAAFARELGNQVT